MANGSSVTAACLDKSSSHALQVMSPCRTPGHHCGYPMSKSPDTLSDVSSTHSSCNDLMNSGLSNDLDSNTVTDSLTLFQSANYLMEKLP